MRIILASKSPRRIEMLQRVGLSPEIIPAQVDENIEEFKSEPRKAVLELSERKAKKIYSLHGENDTLIIAADTLVYHGKRLLGKPRDEREAKEMLSLLSDNTHEVYTGVSVMYGSRLAQHCEATKVIFNKLSESDIDGYIATGEPMDKAGAYGIQEKGALLVRKIDGDYFNVVGLPLSALFSLIKNEFSLELSHLIK